MKNSTFVAKSGQAKRAACIVPTCKHLVWNKREQIGNEKGDRAGKITERKVENSTALDPTAATAVKLYSCWESAKIVVPLKKVQSSCQDRNLFTMERSLQSFQTQRNWGQARKWFMIITKTDFSSRLFGFTPSETFNSWSTVLHICNSPR